MVSKMTIQMDWNDQGAVVCVIPLYTICTHLFSLIPGGS